MQRTYAYPAHEDLHLFVGFHFHFFRGVLIGSNRTTLPQEQHLRGKETFSFFPEPGKVSELCCLPCAGQKFEQISNNHIILSISVYNLSSVHPVLADIYTRSCFSYPFLHVLLIP